MDGFTVNPILGEPRVLLRRRQKLKFCELATGQLQEFVEPVKKTSWFICHPLLSFLYFTKLTEPRETYKSNILRRSFQSIPLDSCTGPAFAFDSCQTGQYIGYFDLLHSGWHYRSWQKQKVENNLRCRRAQPHNSPTTGVLLSPAIQVIASEGQNNSRITLQTGY